MAKSYKSLAELIQFRVNESPDLDAFYSPEGTAWRTWKWREVGEKCRNLAGGLVSLGMGLEDRIGILSSTRVEWIFADFAVLLGGGATSTIYPSNTPEECQYILDDSGAIACIVENDKQFDKIQSQWSALPKLKFVITIDGASKGDNVVSLADLEAKGKAWNAANPGKLDEIIAALHKDMLATLIYTSGTTGKPKGVELTHDCWLYTGEGMDALGFLSPQDKQFLWLPMSHSFGKVLEVAIVYIGVPTAIDGRIEQIVPNLAVIQPTFMAAAPRIFEKVYNKVVSTAKDGGGLRFSIFKWAIGVGRQISALRQAGSEPSGLLALQGAIADRLVFTKLRNTFGGKIRFFISGSAPLSKEMAEFFHAAGMLILEGYGLTESSAASFVNTPNNFKFGTVGLPLPGTQVKLAPEDGEILIQSRGIMRGYYNLPDATKESLGDDRWLRTGDIGELTDKGLLKITDRKKDLIKTSGGKYVAPQHVEGSFKALCPYVSQILVHGNNRNYCTALITMDPESIQKWAAGEGLTGMSAAELSKHEKTRAMVQEKIDELNAKLPSYETIKKFAILEADFTVETGELTPSLKVKRKVVETRHKDLIESFYTGQLQEV